MAKVNKECSVRVRITKKEYETITDYCDKHEITISEFMRSAIYLKLGGKINERYPWI